MNFPSRILNDYWKMQSEIDTFMHLTCYSILFTDLQIIAYFNVVRQGFQKKNTLNIRVAELLYQNNVKQRAAPELYIGT
ncbi:hypothetical protein V1478_007938 [Vespula squamosa]|uniref:Uncharacterized protein n=1 Tax=Vespula squamosa TaxID=30214 RepID=A0ABD2AXR1_VESSQ